MDNFKFYLFICLIFTSVSSQLISQCTGITEWATTCDGATEIPTPKSTSSPRCVDTCVPTAAQSGSTNCGDMVQWYKVTTDTLSNLMTISISGVAGNIEVYQENCFSTHVACRPFTSDDDVLFAVNIETTYYLAISSLEEGVDFELCVSTTIQENRCAIIELIPERLEHPDLLVTDPYFPGERIRFHCTIDFYSDNVGEGNNCQWLQGLLPSIGAGWDLIAKDIQDQLPGVGWFWLPQGSVNYNVFSSKLSTQSNPRGGTELVFGEGSLFGNDRMPEGWWFVSAGVGTACMNNGDPDGMWGLPSGCDSNSKVEFQFDLQVTETPSMDDLNNPNALKLEIFALADGQTGCWSNTTCGGTSPGAFSTSISVDPLWVHNAAEGSLSIYPNPVTNKLVVTSKDYSGSYELLTTDGILVKTGMIEKEVCIDLYEQPNGIYVLTIKDSQGQLRMTERIVK